MKKSLKLLSSAVFAVAGFSLLLTSCIQDQTFELALITDIGDIDDKSFNQGSWEGLVEYAQANNKTYQYYRPAEVSTGAYIESIGLAVEQGAKVIITPGFLFEVPIFQAQDQYPETKFVLLDGQPNDGDWVDGPEFRIEDNVLSIFYAEEQAGFLAGYGAVMDGYRALGFMGGMAVPAVVRFGIGFAQGAQAAAEELELTTPVTLRYHYTGDFVASPKNRTTADNMFTQGAEIIFAAGGAVGQSVMAAAEAAEKKVIGVDVDQSGDSETVVTSAMKGLGASVIQALTAYYADEWPGGEIWNLDAALDGIGLPTETDSWRFDTWTVAEYEDVFADLVDGTLEVSADLELSPSGTNTSLNTLLNLVTVTFVA
jgi:basic membrane protein A and related proteins